MVTHKFILILFGNLSAYNVASSLSGTDYKPLCFMPRNFKNLLRHMVIKWSNKFHKVKISKYSIEEHEFVNELIKFVKSFHSKIPIPIYFTDDLAIHLWQNNKDRLLKYCHAETHNIELYSNKINFFKLLEKYKIQYPKTWYFKNVDKEFPLLVKPAYKDYKNKFKSLFGAKAMIIHSKDEFQKFDNFSDNELIFQEIIEFDLGDEYSWFGYRTKKNDIISVVARHKSKYPDKMGRITNSELIDNPVLKSIGDTIVEKTDFLGIADIQFLYDKQAGMYKVIEMNPRIWCGNEILPMNGLNLVLISVSDYYQNYKKETHNNRDHKNNFQPPGQFEWYSILDNIRKKKYFKPKCTEFFKFEEDNFKTKILIKLFLFIKFIYYYFRKVI